MRIYAHTSLYVIYFSAIKQSTEAEEQNEQMETESKLMPDDTEGASSAATISEKYRQL